MDNTRDDHMTHDISHCIHAQLRRFVITRRLSTRVQKRAQSLTWRVLGTWQSEFETDASRNTMAMSFARRAGTRSEQMNGACTSDTRLRRILGHLHRSTPRKCPPSSSVVRHGHFLQDASSSSRRRIRSLRGLKNLRFGLRRLHARADYRRLKPARFFARKSELVVHLAACESEFTGSGRWKEMLQNRALSAKEAAALPHQVPELTRRIDETMATLKQLSGDSLTAAELHCGQLEKQFKVLGQPLMEHMDAFQFLRAKAW